MWICLTCRTFRNWQIPLSKWCCLIMFDNVCQREPFFQILFQCTLRQESGLLKRLSSWPTKTKALVCLVLGEYVGTPFLTHTHTQMYSAYPSIWCVEVLSLPLEFHFIPCPEETECRRPRKLPGAEFFAARILMPMVGICRHPQMVLPRRESTGQWAKKVLTLLPTVALCIQYVVFFSGFQVRSVICCVESA